ncbi:Pkinase-domain-containing protein [Xylaria sp. CBS 124048]|nr:Pkinase-domain-containing protein [Xylaria sp. CBS 124048]
MPAWRQRLQWTPPRIRRQRNKVGNLCPLLTLHSPPSQTHFVDSFSRFLLATQNAFDPRRIGQQNSGFSDQDISDIICLLYPKSEAAHQQVKKIVSSPEYACHTVGRYSADAIESDLSHEDDARNFGHTIAIGDHVLVLRLSSPLKDPAQGFTFGRNPDRADIHFDCDPYRRLSNVHFRIFVNDYGSVLLEDESTNGTVIDETLLRKKKDPENPRRTLESGAEIKIVMHESQCDLVFRVRIPRREGEYEDAYTRNVAAYLKRANGEADDDDDDDPNKTIGPGPSGHVNLFAPTRRLGLRDQPEASNGLQRPSTRLPREWRGGDKYARVGVIGKGAFATVHKVTSKYSGRPYAAKELDKRKFMKNGVLDQKVENEMKIMQKVQHPNIVQYVEHLDWDVHQFIIIMEFVEGGDLGKYIQENGAIAETHVKIIAEQLVDALGYLHENKITHRDVKPDNILIHTTNPLVVKLTDFGLSKMIDTEQTFLKTFCGTLLYCAPEVYNEYASYDDYGRRTNRKNHRTLDKERYDHAVDIWSLGGVLFYTLTASPPFPVGNGITYTELLDHIMKTPLNFSPLTRYDVSANGVNFISRMIHVRPETRATIAELKSHAWLAHSSSPTEPDYEDDLGQSASQLSLEDRQSSQTFIGGGASPLYQPELDYSMNFESEKENATFGRPPPAKLFGEVSAIGTSNGVPEDRLNLPLSDASIAETKRYGSEVGDSTEDSDFSTPRGKASNVPLVLSDLSPQDNSRSALLGMGSQSLGGTSSILENLNMKSVANAKSGVMSTLATSKRKPNHDTSDEYDTPRANVKPSRMKRLKAQRDVDDIEGEDELLASIPKVIKSDTGRQINYPISKRIFWDSSDGSTWHLDYPEMTHIQYNAFETAAEKRGETFGPKTTPLWRLAMKYFPPTDHQKDDQNATEKAYDWDVPATAPWEPLDSQLNSQLAASEFDNHVLSASTTSLQPKTEIGMFKSTSGSSVTDISFPLQEPILSWGRGGSNTVIYEPATESKVPKNAFRVLLWREGYTASDDEFRPWDAVRQFTSRTMLSTNRTMRDSPEPDSYAFYIATKATNGIRINANPLPSHEPKNATATAPCKHWMKLHHGDQIAFWGGGDDQAKLTFECSWGGSSVPRPADEPPTCVAAPVAQKLDRLWPKTIKSLGRSLIKEKAQAEQEVRMRNMLREQERSRVFELRRLEAVRRVEQRASRGPSPAVTERARSVGPARWFTPGPAQNGR